MSDIAPAEPWSVRQAGLSEHALTTAGLRQAESIFALANGHIGLRGNLDENDPRGMPGTYLNSFYEVRDLTYPEAGYGYPERTETVVDAPNGKLIALTVDDEPFDVRTGTLRLHERVLDLRAGTLRREVEWVSPGGAEVRITSTRLVSFRHPSVAAIRYQVEAPGRRLRIDSDLLANEEQPEQRDDPRAAATLHHPLRSEGHEADPAGGLLRHRTRRSGIGVAAAVTHVCDADLAVAVMPDRVRCTVTAEGTVRLDKILAYSWGADVSADRARADRDEAARLGFDELAARQRAYLDEFWDTADVEIDGDPEVQQGVRFGLFHVLQAGAQAGPHPIAAKGLTGNGYDGHTLWDTESFVLPVLTYTHPACVGLALRWRHATLPKARERAAELRLAGATYPWRTISGAECSGYWPAGTAALHVDADIADAVLRYVAATGDHDLLRDCGIEMLVETARLWDRVAHTADADDGYHISGITGPDEYTALVDDNVFTNLMAQRNLRGAAWAAEQYPGPAHALDVTADEITRWRTVADRMHLPYDEKREVHQQAAGFTRLEEWDFAGTKDEDYPLMMHFPYLDLYRKQVIKQADLVLAMVLRGDAFTVEEKARNFAYYEARTVRDSSLSAPAQAVLAAETGHLDLAHDYLAEAALLDLRAGGESSGDGLHIAACAGAWIALVMGLGGLRDTDGRLSFAPRLPRRLPRLRFRLRWRDSVLCVTATPGEARYEVTGDPLTVRHHGEEIVVRAGEPVVRSVPAVTPGPVPAQPAGRAPERRAEALERA
ncbi:glycoside hydrolase family 65 protein [Jidongwangia harbinensis]|uniref:glycoside hydrolase family 65 protein n=1 Tax=Jidongwangia harbinensis TaxID=2878561 RepID=UPI001CD91B96|nr:glycosyl hydrolase family 65 protein [Jidongwangia harbinensis]MCA2216150.1 family 65 glycosyl hydrolase [Jidongwangia harbinensis]